MTTAEIRKKLAELLVKIALGDFVPDSLPGLQWQPRGAGEPEDHRPMDLDARPVEAPVVCKTREKPKVAKYAI